MTVRRPSSPTPATGRRAAAATERAGARRLLRTLESLDPSSRSLGRPGAVLAPAPSLDRYPTVVGAGVTLAYISAALRSATNGQREQYCDLLSELVERDPHAFSVLSKRILAVAGGRVEITAAVTAKNDPDYELAQDVAEFVAAQVGQIDDLATTIAGLLWALFYGVGGAEMLWEKDAGDWVVRALQPIASRRLWYPDPASWDVYVYQAYDARQATFRGLRVLDFPGKFIVHAPALRGDAPTREGLGRELAYWMALKGVGARAAVSYVEGYSRPKYLAKYTRRSDGKPSEASRADVALAKTITAMLASGTFASGVIPDAITLDLLRTEGGISHEAWIELCDNQMTKAVLGQTGTTDIGKNGSRAQAQTMRSDQVQITRYDAQALAATLRRDLIRPIVLMNFPGAYALVPRVTVHANENPDPAKILAMAKDAVSISLRVDAEQLGAMIGLPLVPIDDEDALVAVPAAAKVPTGLPSDAPEEENPADPDQPAGEGGDDDGAPDDEGETGMRDDMPAGPPLN